MSKAFTKETAPEEVEPDEDWAMPGGVPNYMTPAGHRRLEAELVRLRTGERPKVVETVSWAAANGDRSENGDYIYGKKRLREIDRRIRFLTKRLEMARVVDPAQQKVRDRVLFGATVTYADAPTNAPTNAQGPGDDNERTVRIVGIDEARLDHGEVSWISPIARALLKAEEGDLVRLQAPGGETELEVVRITYDADDGHE